MQSSSRAQLHLYNPLLALEFRRSHKSCFTKDMLVETHCQKKKKDNSDFVDIRIKLFLGRI